PDPFSWGSLTVLRWWEKEKVSTGNRIIHHGGDRHNEPHPEWIPGLGGIYHTVCVAISLCGLVGNGVVMWFLGFHTKQSPFTVYILNLAVADFSLLLLLFLLVSAFLTMVTFCRSLFPFIDHYREFVFAIGFPSHLFDLSSLGLLSALSVERCISVLCPIWYRCHRPRHLSGIVSGILWALAGVLVSSLYVTHTFTEDPGTILAGVALAISAFYSLMMLVSNMLLFLKLCCGSRRRHPGKLFVAILLNVLVFFAFEHLLAAGMLNCTLNPVIYVLVGSCRRRRFQRSIKVALRRVFEEKAGPGSVLFPSPFPME
uniref:G-protein coupled receptors family 1 profile domain-containing protein n=1 Tax=Malurus cyaneus samueli TaxID=2593467 RepID=A0A8C5TX28_9PASS